MTRVKINAVEDAGNTADGSVFVRYTTHVDGGVYTASTALGGGGGGSLSLSAGTSSAALGSVVLSNSNNVSFGLNGSTVTASASLPAQTGISGLSAGTTLATSGTVSFANSNNVSFGLNGQTLTASVATSLTAVNVSAGAASANLSNVVLSNSNGVLFGLNGSTITASHNGLTTQSNQQLSLYAVGNTTQSSSGTQGAASLSFRGEGVASVGVTNGSVVVSVPAGGGGGSVNFSAGTTSNNLNSVVFSNNNGVSFGLNGSTITASHNGIQSAEVNGTLFGPATLGFSNSNGITFGRTVATITASHNGLTSQSNQALSAANGSFAFQTATFANSNGVSFSTGTQGLYASHNGLTSQSNQAFSANGGASAFQTLSLLDGNGIEVTNIGGAAYFNNRFVVSAGTSSTKTHQLDFGTGGNVTFGYSAGTITASAPSGGGGAGATVSQWPNLPWPMATSSVAVGTTGGTGGSTQITGSLYISPLILPVAVSFDAVAMPISANTSAGTGSVTKGHLIGIYTLNGATLSRVTSWMWGMLVSQNSVTAQTINWWYGTNSTANTSSLGGNVSASFARLANIYVEDKNAQSLSAGHYWIAQIHTRRSSGVDVWPMGSQGRYSVSQFTAAPEFGGSTTSSPYGHAHGIASVTTNVAGVTAAIMPASIATTAISNTGGTSRNQWPVAIFHRRGT